MLANPNGSQQSMTLHPCQLGDPDFLPLPKAWGASTAEICRTCMVLEARRYGPLAHAYPDDDLVAINE